jgi:hypothetical protein
MASYTQITGYIEDIYEGETKNGTPYLGIRFYTQDEHDNDTGNYEIKWWFSKNSVQYDVEKVFRLLEMTDPPIVLPENQKPNTIKNALKALMREELAALEIPVSVQPNEYNDRVYAQYDLGWFGPVQHVPDEKGFGKFADKIAERLKDLKTTEKNSPEVSSEPYSDEIPF